MVQIFRQIYNRPVWEKGVVIDEVPEGQPPADILKSFKTEKSGLSIYFVDEGTESVNRLLAAYCANRENVGTLDYVLVRKEDFDELQLSVKDVPGDLPDAEVSAWHRDVVGLSIDSLTAFAKLAHERGQVTRVLAPRVGLMLNERIQAGHIDGTRLNPALTADLKNPKYLPRSA